MIWNPSFHIIHAFLQEKARSDARIQQILDANPLAETLKLLNLTNCNEVERQLLLTCLRELEIVAPTNSKKWNDPSYLEQFTKDLLNLKNALSQNSNQSSGEPSP